jgi:hypothetical protein
MLAPARPNVTKSNAKIEYPIRSVRPALREQKAVDGACHITAIRCTHEKIQFDSYK